ncbi:MAG: FHA domain-containing protein [Chloroflexi bacterium]|nr:FHA domain-containing protein [Chloroflexota bacterium]MCY3583248.1 FHA domain-containing protein [Chloroflexota bacterium]MCY3716824.1 FHA domain-containing protein [Chloroflexota bacterium]MDE2651763.1 FHA domain-containing protein [Chloroflexota bacterium]MXV92871.1 FHA domain-containing protein [Chloroflexota bacterium]
MQQNDSFRLVVRRGPQPNESYEIGSEATTLGRGINNDIVINDREISRSHLRLLRAGDGLTLEDLGSTNGTFVNGKRIAGITPLQVGDMIGLGDTVVLALESARDEAGLGDLLPGDPADAPTPGPHLSYGLQSPSEPIVPPPVEPYAQPEYANYPDASVAHQPPSAPTEQPAAPQQPAAYGPQQPAYAAPPPPQQYPAYDYDPYAAREERSGTSPWLILGCFVFFVLVFVCFAGIALVLVDMLNLWCDLPVLSDIVSALGLGC